MEILIKLSKTENFVDKIKNEIIIYLKELLDDKTKKVNSLIFATTSTMLSATMGVSANTVAASASKAMPARPVPSAPQRTVCRRFVTTASSLPSKR